MKIKISAGKYSFTAILNKSKTAAGIFNILPLTGTVNTWGKEIYFSIPFSIKEDSDARVIVDDGELGFWPVGNAFCIFFGPTPASTDNKPRAYSPVNVFGKIEGNTSNLKEIKSGEKISISKIQD
jgi:hypothetical protein